MKKATISALLLIMGLAGFAGGALAQSKPEPKPAVQVVVPHGYIGIAAGRTIFATLDDAVNAPGATASTLNQGDSQTAYRLFGGYRFHRNLSVNATFTGQTFKHILAPIWLLTYVYGATSYQVVVNGVTGTMSGSRPWSWIKVSLVVLAALILFLLFVYLDNS